jgi:hypothetical protein
VIRFYDAATMKQVRAFDYCLRKSWQAAWFPGGQRILTDGPTGAACIWDVNAGVPLFEFPVPGGIACVAVSPDGGLLLAGYETDGKIRVWDSRTERQRFEIAGQVCHPNSAHFVLGGNAILSCGRDGSIRLFDSRTGKLIRVFRTPKKVMPWARIAL